MKKLVGQGLFYIRMKMGFELVLCENNTSDSDSELLQSGALKIINIPSASNGTFCTVSGTPDGTSAIVPCTSNDNSGILSPVPLVELLIFSLAPLIAILVLSLAPLMAILVLTLTA